MYVYIGCACMHAWVYGYLTHVPTPMREEGQANDIQATMVAV